MEPDKNPYPMINLSMGIAIADNPEDCLGQFICSYIGDGQRCYEAIDNRNGTLNTQTFMTQQEAVTWLTKQL